MDVPSVRGILKDMLVDVIFCNFGVKVRTVLRTRHANNLNVRVSEGSRGEPKL